MAEKRNRDRVNAEITLSFVMRLASEQDCPVTREQAMEFLNREGLAYEMWKHMMHAGVDFIMCSFLRQHVRINTTHLRFDQDRSIDAAVPAVVKRRRHLRLDQFPEALG